MSGSASATPSRSTSPATWPAARACCVGGSQRHGRRRGPALRPAAGRRRPRRRALRRHRPQLPEQVLRRRAGWPRTSCTGTSRRPHSVGDLLKHARPADARDDRARGDGRPRRSSCCRRPASRSCRCCDDGKPVGSIQEVTLARLLHDRSDPDQVTVGEIMARPLPQLDVGVAPRRGVPPAAGRATPACWRRPTARSSTSSPGST